MRDDISQFWYSNWATVPLVLVLYYFDCPGQAVFDDKRIFSRVVLISIMSYYRLNLDLRDFRY
jgi:hypothetical protein